MIPKAGPEFTCDSQSESEEMFRQIMKLARDLLDRDPDRFKTLVAHMNEIAPREPSPIKRAPGAQRKGLQANGKRRKTIPFRKYELPDGWSSKEYYQCESCGERRLVNSFHNDHQVKHPGEKFNVRWYCPLCDRHYAVTHRSCHIDTVHPKDENGKKRPSHDGSHRSSGSEEDDDEGRYKAPEPKQEPRLWVQPSCPEDRAVTVAHPVPPSHNVPVPVLRGETQGVGMHMGEESYRDGAEGGFGGYGYDLPPKRPHPSDEPSSLCNQPYDVFGPHTQTLPQFSSSSNGPYVVSPLPVDDPNGGTCWQVNGANGGVGGVSCASPNLSYQSVLSPNLACTDENRYGFGSEVGMLFPENLATIEKPPHIG